MIKQIISIIFLGCIFILVLNSIQLISTEQKKVSEILASLSENKISIEKNAILTINATSFPKMKVDFWKIKQNPLGKGKYIGSATIINKHLFINVTDPKLRKILKNPYVPIAEMTVEGTARDWQISYPPGSVSQLKAIAREVWRWGYVAQEEKLKKN